MKRIIIILVAVAFVITGYTQQKPKEQHKKAEIPEVVKASFDKEFPGITKVKWDKERDGEYEAEFHVDKTKTTATFDNLGNLVETETLIGKSALPQTVGHTLQKDFTGYRLKEVSKAVAKGVTTYEMEANKNGRLYELVFDESGKLLRKEALKRAKD